MAVAFDALGTGTSTTSASSLTWSHTCTGADGLLTVSAAIRSTPAGFPASATYNGVAMTKANNQATNNSTDGYVVLFYLLAPATGANNVVVSWTGGAATAAHPCLGHSVSYTGVASVTNVTTPTWGASGLNTVTVTSATGNMPHATMASAIGYSATNQTLRNRNNFSTANAAGNLQSVDAAGAASVTLNGTANDWWAVIGIDLVASGGGGGAARTKAAVYNRAAIVRASTF